ncbi:hypothetical protein MLD52_03605 [Puniceicoccaceae bacterium K14]|nr:hypothetical protein [Puniceicoccaceae bacterium K14]
MTAILLVASFTCSTVLANGNSWYANDDYIFITYYVPANASMFGYVDAYTESASDTAYADVVGKRQYATPLQQRKTT